MKFYLSDDPRSILLLATENDSAVIEANMGIITQPNGDDVQYLTARFPTDRTYLARNLSGDNTFSILVLPEGLTPATFGWDDILAVRLSTLVQELKDDIT